MILIIIYKIFGPILMLIFSFTFVKVLYSP